MPYGLTPGTDAVVVDGDVRFSITINGIAQRFQISREALDDHFGDSTGRAEDRLAAFTRGQPRIIDVAARKYGVATTHDAGTVILLSTFDF